MALSCEKDGTSSIAAIICFGCGVVTYSGISTNMHNTVHKAASLLPNRWKRIRTMQSKFTCKSDPSSPPLRVPVPGTPWRRVSSESPITHLTQLPPHRCCACKGAFFSAQVLEIVSGGRAAHRGAIFGLCFSRAYWNASMHSSKTPLPPSSVTPIAVNVVADIVASDQLMMYACLPIDNVRRMLKPL